MRTVRIIDIREYRVAVDDNMSDEDILEGVNFGDIDLGDERDAHYELAEDLT